MGELVLVLVITWAFKHAWDHSRSDFQKSKAAHRQKQPAKQKRPAEVIHHDIGYWAHQGTHGFPAFRHGFGKGWHEARQKAAAARAERERARTQHLETAADLEPEVTELRRRQAGARDRIREARQPGEGGEDGSPADPDDLPAAADGQPDGRHYSYGRADFRYHWPAGADADKAHYHAKRMGTADAPWVVTEYPPGGGPGKTIATYPGSEQPQEQPAQDQQPQPRQPQETPTGGNPMAAAEITYTQHHDILTAIRDDAEAQVNDTRMQRMQNQLEGLAGMLTDPRSLSNAAEIDDALREQQKAAQATLDAADHARSDLEKDHGGINQAVADSPVERAADPAYYDQ